MPVLREFFPRLNKDPSPHALERPIGQCLSGPVEDGESFVGSARPDQGVGPSAPGSQLVVSSSVASLGARSSPVDRTSTAVRIFSAPRAPRSIGQHGNRILDGRIELRIETHRAEISQQGLVVSSLVRQLDAVVVIGDCDQADLAHLASLVTVVVRDIGKAGELGELFLCRLVAGRIKSSGRGRFDVGVIGSIVDDRKCVVRHFDPPAH